MWQLFDFMKKNLYLSWLSFPSNISSGIILILPIFFLNLFQKLFPVVDNHYIALLGEQSLLIHGVQNSFISLGQYIGSATATACLIFWPRTEYSGQQKTIFIFHLLLCFIIIAITAIIANYNSQTILVHFHIKSEYLKLAHIYFKIGLCNMILQAMYLTLNGLMLATGQQKLGLFFYLFLLLFNIFSDSIAVHYFFTGEITPDGVLPAMLIIGSSTTVFLILLCIIMTRRILVLADDWNTTEFYSQFKIWLAELGSAFISGIYPVIYAFQLGSIKSEDSLLVSYQLALNLTSVICAPLMASMQLSLLKASEEDSINNSIYTTPPKWWGELLYIGLIPSQLLLIITTLFISQSFGLIYNYKVPFSHFNFVLLFFIATIIGQIGNALTVFIRAKKRNLLITKCYFFADIIIMLGGMQLIIFTEHTTPNATGIVTLLYAIFYTGVNFYYLRKK